LEVRAAISPRPPFIARVRLIMASIRQWYPGATCKVSCWPPPTAETAAALGEEWSVPAAAEVALWTGTRAPFMATVLDTYRPPFTGDHVLHLDADTIPILTPAALLQIDGLAGVPAHHGPCRVDEWHRIFTAAGLPTPHLDMPYSGFGIMFDDEIERFGPRGYFNSGMMIGPRAVWERLAEPYADAVEFLRRGLADHYWTDQLATPLAVAAAGIPTFPLGLVWNWPNRAAFDAADPDNVRNIRFAHLMDTSIVDRDRDFADEAALDRLCARTDLTGSNEVARRRVAELRGL